MSRTFVRVDSLQNLKRLARKGAAFKHVETIHLLDKKNIHRAITALETTHAAVAFILPEDELLAANVVPTYFRGDYMVSQMPAALFPVPEQLATLLKGVELFDGYALSLAVRDVYPKLEVILTHHGQRALGVELVPGIRMPLQRSQLVCSCGLEPASGWCFRTREPDPINGWGQLRDVRGDLAQGLPMDPLTAAVLLEPMAAYIDSVLAWFREQNAMLHALTEGQASGRTEALTTVVNAWRKTPGGKITRARADEKPDV